MTREKLRNAARNLPRAARVLVLQVVVGAVDDERLRVWNPGLAKLFSVFEDSVAFATDNIERWLENLACLARGELPFANGGQFDIEKRRGILDRKG